MQYTKKEYDPRLHDAWNALTIKQPYADAIADGEKTIEVRSRNTKYRGDILICSSKTPEYPTLSCGTTLALVELYDVKPVSEFTDADWEKTRIPREKRKTFAKGYGWLLRNARRVIEYPMKGQLGIYKYYCPKDEIIEYPRVARTKEEYDKLFAL